MPSRTILINRAPVLTLWAAVVAERLGYDRDAALSLGKAVAGLTAQSKGQRLGVYEKREHAAAEEAALPEVEWIELAGRLVPTQTTPEGIRAVIRGQAQTPASTQRYLESKFGPELEAVRKSMLKLAAAFKPGNLNLVANRLYEKFRPRIPEGVSGWGAKGKLDLDLVESLGRKE